MMTQNAYQAINKAEKWLLTELKSQGLGMPDTEETISYFASRKTYIYDSEALFLRWKNLISNGIRYNSFINPEDKKRAGITHQGFYEITNMSFKSLSTIKDYAGSCLFDFINLPDFASDSLGPKIANTCDWLGIDFLEDWIDRTVYFFLTAPSDAYCYQLFEWCRTKRIFHEKYNTMFRQFCIDKLFNLSNMDHIPSYANSIFCIKRLNLESLYSDFDVIVNNLLGIQKENGAWDMLISNSISDSKYGFDDIEDCIYATCCAMHAIAATKPKGWCASLRRAKKWLLKNQKENGCWIISGGPIATTTILALDSINLAEQIETTIYSFMKVGMGETRVMKYRNFAILYTSDREKIAIDNVLKKRRLEVLKNNSGDLFFTTVSLKNGILIHIVGLTNQGQAAPGAASNTTYSVAVNINPDAIIMGGICFGYEKEPELGEEKIKVGDVLISQRIWDYEYQSVMDNSAEYRGNVLLTSQNLLRLFRRETPKKFNTKYGLMASGNKLVRSPDFKEKLLEIQPKLIGGDMEGYAVTSVCHDKTIDCIMVKGISDLGDNLKDDKTQIEAATNAFNFIFCSIESIIL